MDDLQQKLLVLTEEGSRPEASEICLEKLKDFLNEAEQMDLLPDDVVRAWDVVEDLENRLATVRKQNSRCKILLVILLVGFCRFVSFAFIK